MSRGKRESHWLVMRRCLAIIRRLQRGPTDWRGLVEAVFEQEGSEVYGYRQERRSPDLLYDDLARIRNKLFVDVKVNRRTGEYTIHDTQLPLLDLSDDNLSTIAWLKQIFNPNSPKAKEVQVLLQQLQSYLSPERRESIRQRGTALIMDLKQRDADNLDPAVEAGLTRALARRLRVEFDYRSPQHGDEQPRRHVVDFYEPPYFNPERGHYYVYGWCHYAVGPDGQEKVNDYTTYRLGRISDFRLLPDRLAPTPPTLKQYQVIYWLSQDIARYGVSQRRWINIERVEQQEDGVVIYGTTGHIFFAVQELMHYQSMCKILGGPEMLTQMKQSIKKMAGLYQDTNTV